MYREEVVTSLEQLVEKEQEWKNLESKTGQFNLTTSFSWVTSFLKNFKVREDNQFGYNKKIIVVFLYKNNELIAIAPFIKLQRKKYGLNMTVIEFIGQQWGATFLDIIGNDLIEMEINRIFKLLYATEKFDLISLGYIPSYTKNFNLEGSNVKLLSAAPYLMIGEEDSFETIQMQYFSKKLRQNIRTAKNKMAKQELVYSSSINEMSKDILDEVVRISKMKLIDGKSSFYLEEDKKRFIESLTNSLKSNVVFCEMDNKKVAYRLNFLVGDRKYCFDAAYDRDYPKFELGAISIEESLKDSIDKKVRYHSEGIGLDFYKTKMMKSMDKVYNLLMKGNTMLSPMYYQHELKKKIAVEEDFVNSNNIEL